MSAVLSEVPVTVRVWLSPPPAAMPVRLIVCNEASSRMAAGFEMAASVGASLMPVTLTVKVRVVMLMPPFAVPPLSCTVTVMTAEPLALATGV